MGCMWLRATSETFHPSPLEINKSYTGTNFIYFAKQMTDLANTCVGSKKQYTGDMTYCGVPVSVYILMEKVLEIYCYEE